MDVATNLSIRVAGAYTALERERERERARARARKKEGSGSSRCGCVWRHMGKSRWDAVLHLRAVCVEECVAGADRDGLCVEFNRSLVILSLERIIATSLQLFSFGFLHLAPLRTLRKAQWKQ